MLRYFHILICVGVSFSYAFIEKNRLKGLQSRDGQKHNVRSNVIQLDMESFMSSDDPQDYEPFEFNAKLNRRSQIEDFYESPINKFKREENADYSRFKEVNNGETIDSLTDNGNMNVRNSDEAVKDYISAADEREREDMPDERRALQDPQKNCVFRNMKIPFFSHKTTKQQKRRKLECMNCGSLYANDTESEANENVKVIVQRLKKIYGNICPNCIQSVLEQYNRKKLCNSAKPNQIYNSKEFYQNMGSTVSKEKQVEKKEDKVFDYYTVDDQKRRDDDQQRQLKELAEVEMKVQQVEVTTPKIGDRIVTDLKLPIINDV